MNDRSLLILILGVSALTLLGLLIMAMLIRRMHYERIREQDSQLARLDEAQDRRTKARDPFVQSGTPFESVITRLSFGESFDPERFALASQQCALSYLNTALASRSADVAVTVSSLHLMPSGVEMV